MAGVFAFSAATRRKLGTVVAVLVVLMVAAAIRSFWFAPRLNIILVTFDTTRADRLGLYGYQGGMTAGFDEFARRGVVFDRAYSPAPTTLPSHATMLTGLYPPEHGLRVNGSGQLNAQIPLLPEILQKSGYDTGAFVSAAVLESQYGLNRGFETYDDFLPRKKPGSRFSEPRRDGQDVMHSAMKWLRQRVSRPFFCWVHLYDAHGPYDARREIYGSQFLDQPYDAGIAWQIHQFETLMKYLKESKLDANTLVVIAGDHGEGLHEHLETDHGMLVYNSTLRVPLVFVGPRVGRPGHRVKEVVSLVDLTPTLLDLLRIPAPKHVSGRSLVAALKGQAIASRDCYAETDTPFTYNHWAPLRTVITDRWKYIQTTRPELYDLEQDPDELTNLAETAVAEFQQLSDRLALLEESFVLATEENLNLSEKDRAKLLSLGYLSAGKGGKADGVAADTEVLRDIKDMLPFQAKYDEARQRISEGELDAAIELLKQIVDATNDFPAASFLLANTLAQVGRLDEAKPIYQSVLAQRADFVIAHLNLGKIFSTQGDFKQAAVEFRAYIAAIPDSAPGHFELASALANLQEFEEAISSYRQAIQLAPQFVAANVSLGQLLITLQRFSEAQPFLEQAIQHEPNSAAAHANLFLAMAQTRQTAKAMVHGRAAVALDPNSFDTRYNVGLFLVMQAQYSEGLSQLRAAQKLRPDDPRPLLQIQQAEEAMRRKPAR
jgi:arylsulfatase A-like enzyme/Tfp pilus assembly protein PilF